MDTDLALPDRPTLRAVVTAELRETGGDSTLEVWPGMLHVQALLNVAPDATAALQRVADFIAARLSADQLRENCG